MYKYVEREHYEGRTIRFSGITQKSIKAMKHLHKVGEVQSIKGYLYRGHNQNQHIGVLVKGDKGTIRFGGFAWGYSGEGPRGLRHLFDVIGVSKEICPYDSRVFGHSPNFRKEDIGDYWKITKEEDSFKFSKLK